MEAKSKWTVCALQMTLTSWHNQIRTCMTWQTPFMKPAENNIEDQNAEDQRSGHQQRQYTDE